MVQVASVRQVLLRPAGQLPIRLLKALDVTLEPLCLHVQEAPPVYVVLCAQSGVTGCSGVGCALPTPLRWSGRDWARADTFARCTARPPHHASAGAR